MANRPRPGTRPDAEPDWVDAPEDFEPLTATPALPPPPNESRRPPARGPEAPPDRASPSQGTTSTAPTEPAETTAAGGKTGPAPAATAPKPANQAKGGSAAEANSSGSPVSDSTEREISARFAEAFLGELGIEPPSAAEPAPAAAPAERGSALQQQTGSRDASFEEQLRQVFRHAARRDAAG